jgi:Arc/MetJ-type ribon-helix-helix transcriptional regulator
MASSGYHRTQLLLDPDQHQDLAEIARRECRSMSDVVREMIDTQLAERKRRELALAAQALLADYSSDKELTAFTALDAEEVR